MSAPSRITAFDGLRGLAAIAVVFGHARLIILGASSTSPLAWPVVRQVGDYVGVWANHAVWLFFILSGLVLVRLAGAAGFDYGRFLLGRLIRLYLPVWAAVLFAAASMLLVSRESSGLGFWVDAHPGSYTPQALVSDLLLVGGTSGNISPLWTLQLEVLFSLLLVVYVTVSRAVPWWATLLVSLALSVAGVVIGESLLIYLPMFGIGAALAQAWPTFLRLATGVRQRLPRWSRTALVIVLILVFGGLQALVVVTPGAPPALDFALNLPGLAVLVVLAGLSAPVGAVLSCRPIHWLGTISFSLYLVHEPVLLAAAHLFHATTASTVIAVGVSIVIAQLFYLAVEAPAHRLARRLGRRPAPVAPPLVPDARPSAMDPAR